MAPSAWPTLHPRQALPPERDKTRHLTWHGTSDMHGHSPGTRLLWIQFTRLTCFNVVLACYGVDVGIKVEPLISFCYKPNSNIISILISIYYFAHFCLLKTNTALWPQQKSWHQMLNHLSRKVFFPEWYNVWDLRKNNNSYFRGQIISQDFSCCILLLRLDF